MTILVCGGRDYRDWDRMEAVLSEHVPPGGVIVHGNAAGVDRMARYWAVKHGRHHRMYPAEWERYGRRAGPIRNQQMLDEEKPVLVIAFPGGNGTRDMVSRARRAGVPVLTV